MHQELYRLSNACVTAWEIKDFEELNFLKNDILLEFKTTYKDPIFTMLDN